MCCNPITIIDKETGEKRKVKCGKCILCRRKKCREWAIKLYHEGMYHKKMCMITLTFRPKFLLTPKIKKLKKIKSRRQNDGTTKKTTIEYTTMIGPHYIKNVKKTGWLITLFIKKLRKKLGNNYISYFAVGEHGTQNTHRAHWHILFFGIDKSTLSAVSIGSSKKNKEIFWSSLIDELWSYDGMKIGMHTISDVTGQTIKYVANYTMKKMYKDEKEIYPTTMRFSNQNKIGIKWARRFHKELRKGYLIDQDQVKYSIPEQYLYEMKRYSSNLTNEPMTQTAMIIEENKEDNIIKMLENGMLSEEEMKKKGKKYEIKYKKQERDTF